MAADQLVSALTYREGPGAFDLAARITGILEELGQGHFAGVQRSAVLRTLAGAAGIKIHSKPGTQVANFLGEKFTPESREELVGKTRDGLVAAAQWLSAFCGVKCDHLLPYAMQLVLLSQFWYRRPPSPEEAQVLRRWFFATSFSGWFAGGNTKQINDDLHDMSEFATRGVALFPVFDERAKPFPERFDLRAARVRAFLLATLVPAGPLYRAGSPVDIVPIFTDDDAAVVPKVFLRRENSAASSSPANRILLPNRDGKGARQQLLDLPERERDLVLQSHCIDEAAWAALVADDLEAFVAARTASLMAKERELLAALQIAASERPTEEAVLDASSG
jgi:hypothetical protein